jgi:hypothetical protein
LLRFADRAPVPAFLPDGLFFGPLLLPLFFAIDGVSPLGSPAFGRPFSWLTNRP